MVRVLRAGRVVSVIYVNSVFLRILLFVSLFLSCVSMSVTDYVMLVTYAEIPASA